jgi:hypothetical protein
MVREIALVEITSAAPVFSLKKICDSTPMICIKNFQYMVIKMTQSATSNYKGGNNYATAPIIYSTKMLPNDVSIDSLEM